MRILLTGANGYIGQQLLPALVEAGYEVIALVRSPRRLEIPKRIQNRVQLVVGDLLNLNYIKNLPKDIDTAYYLIHSLKDDIKQLNEIEIQAATNFLKLVETTQIKQIIYLSGLVNDNNLSPHLQARKKVQDLLQSGKIPVTTLRAGIIIGSGSASFEIMRDLVEKLPVMIAPKWVRNMCQPIAISDVIDYLQLVLLNPQCLGRSFDIGGEDVLSYQEMLLRLAKFRGLKRYILGVPVLTPRLSSYWLYFVTSTHFTLAKALVESLKNNAVCIDSSIHEIFQKKCLSFDESLKNTFEKIEQNAFTSSWKDSIAISRLKPNLSEYIQVPKFGCLTNVQTIPFKGESEIVVERIWTIGGNNGWYYMQWAWVVRGWVDRLIMGIGLRRGRTHPSRLRTGDALDFWRVLLANREQMRLLLYAEMKIPGEAWLEFVVEPTQSGGILHQTATFRPVGLFGRLYWWILYPFHLLIFKGLSKKLVEQKCF